jgi:hypothetical protein
MMIMIIIIIIIIIHILYLRWIKDYTILYNLMLKAIKFVLYAFRI